MRAIIIPLLGLSLLAGCATTRPHAASTSQAGSPLRWTSLSTSQSVELATGVTKQILTLTAQLEVPEDQNVVAVSRTLDIDRAVLLDADGDPLQEDDPGQNVRQAFGNKTGSTRRTTYFQRIDHAHSPISVSGNVSWKGNRAVAIRELQGKVITLVTTQIEDVTLALDASDGEKQVTPDFSVWVAPEKTSANYRTYIVHYRGDLSDLQAQGQMAIFKDLRITDSKNRPVLIEGNPSPSSRYSSNQGQLRVTVRMDADDLDHEPKTLSMKVITGAEEKPIPFRLENIPLP